eukprot:2824554-Pyramimonas_sp.AAC.1
MDQSDAGIARARPPRRGGRGEHSLVHRNNFEIFCCLHFDSFRSGLWSLCVFAVVWSARADHFTAKRTVVQVCGHLESLEATQRHARHVAAVGGAADAARQRAMAVRTTAQHVSAAVQ